MEIQQNTISRDWTVVHRGKTYFVNFMYSDGQILGPCNRGHLEIKDEAGDDAMYEVDRKARLSEAEVDEIVECCLKYWRSELPEYVLEVL